MLTGLSWLALEVKSLERAREFYGETLSMSLLDRRETELVFAAGESVFILRRPTSVPRGGIHTHFAFSIPAHEYDQWWDRLSDDYDLEEAQFGSVKSLYCYDPDGNCVELGQQDVEGPGIDGIFEIVLEVASLPAARSLYADLGFELVDPGEGERRVRMQGPMALELWEPRLGIADGRGGVHVDIGFETPSPEDAVEAIESRVQDVTRRSDGSIVVRDPDGHYLTFCPARD